MLQGHAIWIEECGATYQKLVNKMFVQQIEHNVKVYIDNMLIKSREEDHHLSDLREMFEILCLYGMKLNPSKCVFGVSSGKFLSFMVSQRGVEANPNKIILKMSPQKNVKEVQSLNRRVAALNRFVSWATNKCLPFFRIIKKAFKWIDECQRVFEALKAYLTSPLLLSPSKPNEELFRYLAVSPMVISVALIRKEDRL